MTVEPKLLPLRIRLPFTTEEEFIEKYGSNVARGGLFLATRSPKPEGTGLSFELVLANGARLLRGEGTVVKSQAEGPRAGMTVRFVRLDAQSKALIDRVMALRNPSGERPAEPAPAPPAPPAAKAPVPQAPAPQAPVPQAPAPAPEQAPTTGRSGRPVISAEALRQRAAMPRPTPSRPGIPAVTVPTTPPAPAEPPPVHESPPPVAEQPAPVVPERPSSPGIPRPTTQDLIANAVLEHLAPDEPSEELEAAAPRPPPVAEPPAPAPVEPPAMPVARENPPVPEAPREEPRRPTTPEVKRGRRTILDVPAPAPVTAAPPDVVLGIDLGTSRARVAVHYQGQLQLIPIGETPVLPSLVTVDAAGQLLVGEPARAEAGRAPAHAVHGLPRFLGRRARSPLVRALAGPLPFPLSAGPLGDASVELHGRGLVLPELAAQLLRELKSAAARFLGHEVTRAVLCVPAHFDDRQRAAMREAGTLAGLHILRILNAPSAAALAFGHGRGLARKRLLLVELGGGGLDVSVVQLTGDDLEVITTGGDPTVGGMDFDARLAEAIASDLQAQGLPRPESPAAWVPLLTAAEAAKVALSEQDSVSIPLPGGLPPFTLDRERLEALTADLVQRVTLVVRQVLESSALTPQGLDEVLLLGGQGRSPLVRRRLEESLGVPVRADVEATHPEALGAALLGQGILDAEAGKPGATVSEVLSVPIGVGERGGTLRRVLERNTRLPAEKTLGVPVQPGPLVLTLFQGPSPVATENEYLGSLLFTIERPGEAEVHFSLSQDGTLSLSATLPGMKRQAVTLAAAMPEDAELEAFLTRSPLEGDPGTRPSGLLSGLRKLFGRR